MIIQWWHTKRPLSDTFFYSELPRGEEGRRQRGLRKVDIGIVLCLDLIILELPLDSTVTYDLPPIIIVTSQN